MRCMAQIYHGIATQVGDGGRFDSGIRGSNPRPHGFLLAGMGAPSPGSLRLVYEAGLATRFPEGRSHLTLSQAGQHYVR